MKLPVCPYCQCLIGEVGCKCIPETKKKIVLLLEEEVGLLIQALDDFLFHTAWETDKEKMRKLKKRLADL